VNKKFCEQYRERERGGGRKGAGKGDWRETEEWRGEERGRNATELV